MRTLEFVYYSYDINLKTEKNTARYKRISKSGMGTLEFLQLLL